ncbi:N-acetyltransferase [Clostridium bovifaecis]|uniref:N-acetyltransferase n=1 Tax=Clostridium bovifaecis TaxID=2184719 RepID=A0A6I6EL17_9CLOT|nr:N-acetyltransferase [Clostridium bovifaecis]
MIKELEREKLNEVMEIWKEATIDAHKFIPKDYWLKNYNVVKDVYIPIAKTFVYIEKGKAIGFISIIEGEFIGALFIDINSQGKGIGTELIDFAKKRYKKLSLAVYVENNRAVEFYKEKGFVIESEGINEDSGYSEFIMSWKRALIK